jgi:hypothetical protein
MTDRFNALTVVLDRDIRDDDAQHIIDAIRCLRGVLSVKGEVADVNYCIAHERVAADLRSRLWRALNTAEENA